MAAHDLLIRCSSIGKLMTEPKSKSDGPLSVGARTHIREIAAQELFGVTFEISDRKIEKGNRCEPDSIALINRVRGVKLRKNTERRTDGYLSGEADLVDDVRRRGHDAKTAWSVQTFPICPEDIEGAERKAYDYQMRGYMRLWDVGELEVDYCLVDTPEDLIPAYEPMSLHVVGHIPPHHRVTWWQVTRDKVIEEQIAEKVRYAREYYAQVIKEFDRTHVAAGDWTHAVQGADA